MTEPSVQERYAPDLACFGCGPKNTKGLRIRSFLDDGELVARWCAEPHHQAFPGMMNGGIVGTLLDCHSNWCAAVHLMNKLQADKPPCTVTASYSIKLLRPTPLDAEITLRARAVESSLSRVDVEASLQAGGEICATCTGTFVAVKPGHPAYHRW